MPDFPIPQREHQIDWNRTRAQLRRRIASLLGRSDDSLLEDLTQEALVDVLRVVRREGAHSLGGLLVVVARAVVASEIRRRRRHRARFGDWQEHVDRIVELPATSVHEWDDPLRTLWFLLVEYYRLRKAPCLTIALRFAELGDWKKVAESLEQTHEATRQQWSRCARMFRDELQRNPAQFGDWLGDDV